MEHRYKGEAMETTGLHSSARVAVFLGDRLICILRDNDPGTLAPNVWEVPGGGREAEETGFETAARELDEEVGLTLSPQHILWERRFVSIMNPANTTAFFVAQMPAHHVNEVVFGNEGQGWAMFTLDEFMDLKNALPSVVDRLKVWVSETGGLSGGNL